MHKLSFTKSMLILLVMIAGVAAYASVTSDPVSGSAARGAYIVIPLKLNTTQTVGGINGELDYDVNFFSNPTIIAGPGASGFIALGNVTSPGKFRFVLYSDPTKPLNLKLDVAEFQFTVSSTLLPKSQIQHLTYSIAAASDTAANSLGATFKQVDIKLQGNAANAWALYE